MPNSIPDACVNRCNKNSLWRKITLILSCSLFKIPICVWQNLIWFIFIYAFVYNWVNFISVGRYKSLSYLLLKFSFFLRFVTTYGFINGKCYVFIYFALYTIQRDSIPLGKIRFLRFYVTFAHVLFRCT